MNKITKQQDKKNFNHKGIVFIKKKIKNFTKHHKKRAKKRDFYFLKKGKFVNLKENFRIIFGSAIKNTHKNKNRSRRTIFLDGKILIFPNIYSKHFRKQLWNF